MTTTPTGESTRTLRATGHERGQPVVLEFNRDRDTVRLLTADGKVDDEISVRRERMSLLLGNLHWGTHHIEIQPDERAAAEQLLHAVNVSYVRVERERRRRWRGWGIALLLLSVPLLLASCVVVGVNDVERDTCRAFNSWQSERPVEGCEAGSPAWAPIGGILGFVMLIAGVGMTIDAAGGPARPADEAAR